MLIQELEFKETDLGVLAVSIVPDPAIELPFTTFAVAPKYYYTLKPEYVGEEMVIDTSHSLCKKYAKGDAVAYSVPVIQSWKRYYQYKNWGFKTEAEQILSEAPGSTIDLGNVMFGCRHMLKRVDMFHKTISFDYKFSEVDTKPRRIRGPVMVANKMILRPPADLNGVDFGYVWFSNDTIEKLQKSYGINSSATMLHQMDISNNVIMTKSWVDKTNDKSWVWMAEYHILSDFIWEQIQTGSVRGFSVELQASPKKVTIF